MPLLNYGVGIWGLWVKGKWNSLLSWQFSFNLKLFQNFKIYIFFKNITTHTAKAISKGRNRTRTPQAPKGVYQELLSSSRGSQTLQAMAESKGNSLPEPLASCFWELGPRWFWWGLRLGHQVPAQHFPELTTHRNSLGILQENTDSGS